MELLLTVLKLLWAVRGEQTGCQRGGPPVPGGAAAMEWGRPGREAAPPPERWATTRPSAHRDSCEAS